MYCIVKPSKLSGSIQPPPSKSHTLRAILLASMAKGKSVIRRYLNSPDTQAMIFACSKLGAYIQQSEDELVIKGVAGQPEEVEGIINAGNSGIILRFFPVFAALTESKFTMTGDDSIQEKRVVGPLLSGLEQLGVKTDSVEKIRAPFHVKGQIKPGKLSIDGADSQPVSAFLLASAFMKGTTEIEVLNPGEKPWIDLTLQWLDFIGASYTRQGHDKFQVKGKKEYPAFTYTVPTDLSSAAYPCAAALITNSEIDILNVDLNDSQGDKLFFETLIEWGAKLHWDAKSKTLHVLGNSLRGGEVDVNAMIDALPILSVLGSFAETPITMTNASIARKKESDRISAMQTELEKMNAKVESTEDSLSVAPGHLKGAEVDSHADHRVALSLAVAAMRAEGDTVIQNSEVISKTYPNFFKQMKKLGAEVEEHSEEYHPLRV